MQINSNIDVYAAEFNTNAPFTIDSSMRVGDIQLSYADFLSIVLYCDEDIVPPARIGMLRALPADANGVDVVFVDTGNRSIGALRMLETAEDVSYYNGYITSFICDENGGIVGHAMYAKTLPGAFLSVLSRSAASTVRVNPDAFVLMPQCHVARLRSHGAAIRVNGTTTLDNVYIRAGATTRADVYAASALAEQGLDVVQLPGLEYYCVSAINKYTPNMTSADGYTKLCITLTGETVNRYIIDVSNSHIVLRSSVASNVRVITEFSGITIKGVMDV